TIELTTIDDLVNQLGLERLDAIKMDIEGAEVRALRGARRTIQRFRPQLAVATEHTHDVVQNNRNVIETMRQIAPDYRPRCGYCMLRNGLRRIVPETLYFYPN
ncbi:MAG: FkbM family methyltransferase, partial [Bryobacteraceae bacterium]